jgi:hypothetical protein
VEWNAREAASGVYFCRLEAGELAATWKMILLKMAIAPGGECRSS